MSEHGNGAEQIEKTRGSASADMAALQDATPVEQHLFGFGTATELLRMNVPVARRGWNGRGMWLEYAEGGTAKVGANTVRQLTPFLIMRTADGSFVPWLCSQTDALAMDWAVARPDPAGL